MRRVLTIACVFLLSVVTLTAQPLSFKEPTLDVGLTQWYHPVKARFQFTNVADVPLTVSSVDPGCGCMDPEWTRGVIQPGQNGEVVITYNAEMLGRFDRLVEVRTSLDQQPQLIRMKCKVVDYEVEPVVPVEVPEIKTVVETPKPPVPFVVDYSKPLLHVSESTLVMGNYKPGKKMKGKILVTNRGDGYLMLDRVESSPALVVDCDKVALAKGQTYKIKVWLDTSLMTGPGDVQEFVIISNDQRSERKTIRVKCK